MPIIKKVLVIVFLGMLLIFNAYADQPRVWYKDKNTIHIAHKMHLWEFHNDIKRVAENHCKSFNKSYFWIKDNNLKPNIVKHYKNKIKKEYKKATVIEVFCSDKLLSYAPNDSFTPGNKILYTNFKSIETVSNNSSNNQISTNDKITQSKQICKDLGFKVNTEKFADCALKMMSMQFEATNKIASSGGTKQEIIVKHKNDYDIWDALLDTSALLRSNSTSNSTNSSGTNCKVYQREWGADMVCQ
tara:strand:+ start:825 stop:1556 length:732 start_codon:yes stop_codon:yes gene_type:complete